MGGDARAQRVGIRSGKGKRHSLAEKLAARTVVSPSGCWEVSGAALHSGHVQLSEGSPSGRDFHRVRAHVFAWEQANGQRAPQGMVVMHRCDNPRCVNPDHLRLGTQRDNILDSIRKGRYNVFGHQKLNAQQVLQIRQLRAKGWTQRAIATKFGISRNHVSAIEHKQVWAHLDDPFQWSGGVLEPVPCVAVRVLGDVA